MCVRKHVREPEHCKLPDNSSCEGTPEGHWDETEVDIFAGLHSLRNASYESIDYRDFPFPNEMWIRKPDWEVGLKGTAFLVMIILGVVGNALLLSVVLRNRAIRTPTNLLIANMAVADLATLLLLPWIFLCIDCFQNYVLGEVGCRAQGFIECALLLTGVLNLVAVSYDRLTAIITPMDGRLTVHSTHIVMIFTWLTGLMLGLPLIFLRIYREREWKNFYEIYCTENSVIMPIYWYVVVIFVVWLPLIVMTFCYTRLFVKLDRYEKRVLQQFNQSTVSYKTKVARTIFIVVIVFLICRMPFTALIFMRAELQQQDKKLNQIHNAYNIMWFVSHYLIIVNAALNPIIYGLTNENFRRALFGSMPSAFSPRTNPKPLPKPEPENLGIQNPDLNHWFVVPKPKKTDTTDFYI